MVFDHPTFLAAQQTVNISGALLESRMRPDGGVRRQLGVERHRIVIQRRFDKAATLRAFGQMVIRAQQFFGREPPPAPVFELYRC